MIKLYVRLDDDNRLIVQAAAKTLRPRYRAIVNPGEAHHQLLVSFIPERKHADLNHGYWVSLLVDSSTAAELCSR